MGGRRTLVQGINGDEEIDPAQAEEFIYGPEARNPAKTSTDEAKEPPPSAPESAKPLPPSVIDAANVSASSPLTGVGRVPIGARVRTALGAALKRASLERQLQGIQPNSVQDILEEALELWLLKHGHLK